MREFDDEGKQIDIDAGLRGYLNPNGMHSAIGKEW
jgi:hypothetical protein